MKSDFIVEVDRPREVLMPEGCTLVHPELEHSGPSKYDLKKVEQWLHERQKSGRVSGKTIFGHLENGNMMESCLGWHDGTAIKEKGVAVFLALYGRSAVVFLWRTTVRNRQGNLGVSCLLENNLELEMDWYWLEGFHWGPTNPALRFPQIVH
jgi:hypothetical protein